MEHQVLSNTALGYRAEIKQQALRPVAGHLLLASDSQVQVEIWKKEVTFIARSKGPGANYMYTPWLNVNDITQQAPYKFDPISCPAEDLSFPMTHKIQAEMAILDCQPDYIWN